MTLEIQPWREDWNNSDGRRQGWSPIPRTFARQIASDVDLAYEHVAAGGESGYAVARRRGRALALKAARNARDRLSTPTNGLRPQDDRP